MIVLDLCRIHYQTLLITRPELLIVWNANHAWKEKTNSECCFVGLKNNRLIYRCKELKEEWKRPINELIKTFPAIYQFCKGDLNKFIWMLRKGIYPYEDMDSWEKFDETTIRPKEAFYSKLNY